MPKEEQAHKMCFVVGPIGDSGTPTRDNADMIAEYIVRPAVEALGYRVERADRIAKPGTITDQIIDSVLSAELVVADLTDHNANAFYELALRHMADKPTVHLISRGQRIPFDVADARTIYYGVKNPTEITAARDELNKQIREIEKPGYKPSNPVTRARGIKQLSERGDTSDKLISALSDEVRALRDRVNFAEEIVRQAMIQTGAVAGPSGVYTVGAFANAPSIVLSQVPAGNTVLTARGGTYYVSGMPPTLVQSSEKPADNADRPPGKRGD